MQKAVTRKKPQKCAPEATNAHLSLAWLAVLPMHMHALQQMRQQVVCARSEPLAIHSAVDHERHLAGRTTAFCESFCSWLCGGRLTMGQTKAESRRNLDRHPRILHIVLYLIGKQGLLGVAGVARAARDQVTRSCGHVYSNHPANYRPITLLLFSPKMCERATRLMAQLGPPLSAR
ncbi:hypothetical protein J6590_053163 [Homalodisca vitripennis]|nr:hypothetical protein J6590_053163 [Homalodisca vitripennis]